VNNSGKERTKQQWTTGDNLYFLDSVWIWHSTKLKKTNAYGWDGINKWTLDDDEKGTSVIGPLLGADERGPTDIGGNPTNRDLKSRTQFVTIDGDKINLRSAGTNKVVRSWNNTAGSYAGYALFDGRLFVYGTSTKYTIKAYDLGKDGEPVQIFTAPDEKRQIENVAACGEDRLCVLDSASSSDMVLRFISIPDKKQLWQGDARGTNRLIPVGNTILATATGSSTESSRLFNDEGAQLLKPEDQNGYGGRVSNGSLLFFAKAPSTIEEDVTLTGVTASSGSRVALGTLSKVEGGSCSWNMSKIACVGGGKLQVWSFA